MSNVLKCNVCNIVIDELLSYIQNKISVIDEITLVRICSSAFDSEEIKQSKSLLFNSVPTQHRKILRKSKGKELRDLEDIVSLFKSTDPDVIPVFVARKLEKLPPITFDHLDCTKLLKDLLRLQNDIENVKLTYVTQKDLETLHMELDARKYESVPPSPHFRNINSKRGAWNADSGPFGLSFNLEQADVAPASVQSKVSAAQEVGNQLKSNCQNPQPKNRKHDLNNGYLCDALSDNVVTVKPAELMTNRTSAPPSPSPRPSRSPLTPESAVQKTCSLNKQVSSESECIPMAREQSVGVVFTNKPEGINTVDKGWQQVLRKKRSTYRYMGKRGVASDLHGRFKAAERKIAIFISNIHKDTNENDIMDYVKLKTQEVISLQRIDIKKQKNHHAYKFFVSESKLPLFLDEKLWPEGIIFRRFVHFKQNSVHKNTSFNGHQSNG